MFDGDPRQALNIHDLRQMAKQRLPRWYFEMIDRGTEDEIALRNNRAAFERIKLKTRVMVDTSQRDQSVTIFGHKYDAPIGVSPTGSAGMVYYKGELELARAARAANVPYTVGTASFSSLEDVAREVGGPLWFQLYVWSDINMSLTMVERAKDAGYQALLVTADTPVTTNKEYNVRNGFQIPFHYNRRNTAAVLARPGWMLSVLFRYWLSGGLPTRANYPGGMKEKFTHESSAEKKTRNDSITWDNLAALRDMWPGKLVVKGILTPEDAEIAVARGADGIVVSNHGGRNFDSSMAPIEALPAIVDAVGGKTTIICDSGFRRGSDVVKALAIGANLVMAGRPTLWGTTVAGQAGAARAMEIFRQEISRTLAYAGCRNVAELNRNCLEFTAPPHQPWAM